MPKTLTKILISTDGHSERKPVAVSNMDAVLLDLKTCFKTDDAVSFEKLLMDNFISTTYPEVKQWQYNEKKEVSEILVHQVVDAQPNIEVLFSKNRPQFKELMNILSEEKLPECTKTFIKCMSQTDLEPLTVNWHGLYKMGIEEDLSKMREYAVDLEKKQIPKGTLARLFIDELRNDLNRHFTDGPEDNHDSLERINLKVNFVTKLHQHDLVFSAHREFCKIASANAGLSILGLGVFYLAAGAVKKAKTDSFLFFNKTKTEEFIKDVHKRFDSTLKLI